MINEALQHCSGIGPVRLAHLHDEGIKTWQDVLQFPQRIPATYRNTMLEECRRCLAALELDDIQYFIDRLAPVDKWRILAHYFPDTTFFDIETLGLSSADPITVIVTWYGGEFNTFVEYENLDGFLELLDRVKLLVSFNGSTFDVPRVLDAFHIPSLPCPHIDLRWIAYRRGLVGGIKEIARKQGIARPVDLDNVSGEHAILLWQEWRAKQDHAAREHLIRYCAADVLLLRFLAERLIGMDNTDKALLWDSLPPATGRPPVHRGRALQLTAPTLSSDKRRLNRNRLLLSKRWSPR